MATGKIISVSDDQVHVELVEYDQAYPSSACPAKAHLWTPICFFMHAPVYLITGCMHVSSLELSCSLVLN